LPDDWFFCVGVPLSPDLKKSGILSGDSPGLRVLLALFALLVPALLYWPGLFGPFLLDDGPNLLIISQLPADPGWSDLWRLANTGTAGVLGRPLSLISFLLQYQAWPDPFQFKLVNLLLHLLNGILIAGVCLLLRAQTRWQLTLPAIALIVFIWLVHPLQVSSVLYVVQRMAELAAFFTLLGVNLYLLGRLYLRREENRRGTGLMLTGIVACGLLALFSKETGALLLPFLVVLEFCLLGADNDAPALLKSRRYMVYLLTLTGVFAFLLYLPSALQNYDLKPFSISERVLSQFPILLSYLASIALLFPDPIGLFHDDFPAVTGLLDVWYAIPAIIVVIGVALIAVLKRRQWPLFSFAVLWFLAGHALESTVLPLELYFEHRNYLPLFGPILAVVVTVQRCLQTWAPPQRFVLQGVAGLLLCWMCLLTWQQSRVWGDAMTLAQTSIAAHPDSRRAQSNYVETLTRAGQMQAAFDYFRSTVDPTEARIAQYIRWIEFRCLLPGSPLPEAEILAFQASNSGHDFAAIYLLNNLVFGAIENRCQPAPLAELDIVLANLLQNPAFAISAADLLQMQAFLAASRGSFAEAAEKAATSFEARADVRVALYRNVWLLRAGQTEQARQELQAIATDFGDVIRADADLTARMDYLQEQLGTVIQ